MRGIQNVATEMGLSVLAYNFKRVLSILGFERTKKAMQLLGAYPRQKRVIRSSHC